MSYYGLYLMFQKLSKKIICVVRSFCRHHRCDRRNCGLSHHHGFLRHLSYSLSHRLGCHRNLNCPMNVTLRCCLDGCSHLKSYPSYGYHHALHGYRLMMKKTTNALHCCCLQKYVTAVGGWRLQTSRFYHYHCVPAARGVDCCRWQLCVPAARGVDCCRWQL